MNKIEMCILLEINLNKEEVVAFINKFFVGWNYSTNLDCCMGGRILMLWGWDMFTIYVYLSSEQLVHCCVRVVGVIDPFMLTAVYVWNTMGQRLSLWNHLSFLTITGPWLVCGDFNTIFSSEDKLGGQSVYTNDIIDGIAWLRNCFEVYGTEVFLGQ